MEGHPSSCHSRYLSNNSLCPNFAARIPDSTLWFLGYSSMTEFTDQKVRWWAGCGHLDFTSGFDANPSWEDLWKISFVHRCAGSPWMALFEIRCPPLTPFGLGYGKQEVLAWPSYQLGNLDLHLLDVWFDIGLQHWLVLQQGFGKWLGCLKPDEHMSRLCSSSRLCWAIWWPMWRQWHNTIDTVKASATLDNGNAQASTQ